MIFQLRNRSAGHCPQIQARHAAIRAKPTAVYLKPLTVNAAVVIEHPQSALNSQIVVTKHIGPLHTEQQDHLRCPDANTLQTAQFADHLPVRPGPFAPDL